MAKIPFTKLSLKKKEDIKVVKIGELDIEVKQYLPINNKLILIGNIINQAADENNFANPIKLNIFTKLEIVFNYTNLSFTEKQKEDLVKLYDILESNKIFEIIISALPVEEYNSIIEGVQECAEAIYTYRNSVLGILETISADYSNLNLEASEIQNKLADPNNLTLLKDVLTKMG